jgi:hypothetical protein
VVAAWISDRPPHWTQERARFFLKEDKRWLLSKTAVTESVVWKKSLLDVRGAKARQRVWAPGKRRREWSRRLCAKV